MITLENDKVKCDIENGLTFGLIARGLDKRDQGRRFAAWFISPVDLEAIAEQFEDRLTVDMCAAIFTRFGCSVQWWRQLSWI